MIDLRTGKEAEQGHIPKAVSIPVEKLATMQEQFPKFKAAPIILYNQDGNLASTEKAFKQISDWGFKQVSVLQGGFNAWQAAGKNVAKGPIETKINYVRKLAPGEYEVDKFKELVAKGPDKNTVILDVREKNELDEGKLPNTVNIPMSELESKAGELPKDKEIVIHCATGARAEMAYNVLKKAGVDSKYVKGKVEYDKEDKTKYTIED